MEYLRWVGLPGVVILAATVATLTAQTTDPRDSGSVPEFVPAVVIPPPLPTPRAAAPNQSMPDPALSPAGHTINVLPAGPARPVPTSFSVPTTVLPAAPMAGTPGSAIQVPSPAMPAHVGVGPLIPVVNAELPTSRVGTLPESEAGAADGAPKDADAKKTDGVGDKKTDGASDQKGLTDSLHLDDSYGFKSLFDSLHPASAKGKHWYEKLSIRGYTQFRFGRSLHQESDSAEPFLFGDRSINGTAENFSIRRARLILYGDISDHLSLYFQTDSAVTPPGSSTSSYFTQIRDLYGDVYFDTTRVHRLRVGMSKVPYGWENLQSSQNRLPLDRSNPINSAVPNERDLGVFYYWTPEDKQKLLKDLVDGGLKGSGNYGIFGIGVYNGQASHHLEQNLNLHAVARITWPFQLADGQVVETSLQGYTGQFVVQGDEITPLGVGPEITPAGTRDDDHRGHLDQRIAATFVWYPQPFGIQAEWNVGRGPGLNDEQTAVVRRSLHGGYLMAMYKIDTECHGIITPFARCQYYRGGYKSFANAPYGTHREVGLGVEWQIRKEMELAVEYGLVNGFNPVAISEEGVIPYREFDGHVLRVQFQINY